MRTAVIFSDGMKQIMLTPENDDEKFALSLITKHDDVDIAISKAKFSPYTTQSWSDIALTRGHLDKTQGGYLRVFEDTESLMLVLTPKKKVTEEV